MSKMHRDASVMHECLLCGRRYVFIKNASQTCGAFIKGVTCGGRLKLVKVDLARSEP